MSSPLLVVVHPGSLCGSADMHLGSGAAAVRDAVEKEVRGWPGAVAVIGSDLDDELVRRRYSALHSALGRAALWIDGAPFEDSLAAAAAKVAERFQCAAGDPITVTGAWHDDDGTGCVTCVAAALRQRGLAASISPNAPASDR